MDRYLEDTMKVLDSLGEFIFSEEIFFLLALVLVFVCIGYGIRYVIRRLYDLSSVYTKTRITRLLFSSCSTNTEVRRNFRDFHFSESYPSAVGHSHPDAAMVRTNADNFMTHLILFSGYEPFSPSLSARDRTRNLEGNRPIYWARDVTVNYNNWRQPNSADPYIVKYVDDDYYPENPADFIYSGKHHFLYTFTPRYCSGQIPNGFYATRDNTVEVKISGGAFYKHQLWDYNCDYITVKRYNSWFFFGWIPYKLDVYSVETRPSTDPDFSIVGLFYTGTLWGPLTLFSSSSLKRREFSHGQFNVMETFQDQRYISFSKAGVSTTIAVPEYIYETCVIRFKASLANGNKPAIADLERIIASASSSGEWKPGNVIGDSKFVASTFFEMLLSGCYYIGPNFPRLTHINSGKSFDEHTFQTLSPLVLEDGKSTMRECKLNGYGLKTGRSFAPAKSHNNEVAAVNDRIMSYKNTKRPSPHVLKLADYFIRRVIPTNKLHCGVPVDTQEVLDRQLRPNQRSKFWQWFGWPCWSKFWVTSFIKREMYGKLTSPRIINVVTEDHKQEFSTFTYAYEDAIKSQRWYAFGKQPNELFQAIHEYCVDAKHIIPTDFTKWDLHFSYFFFQLNLAIMKRHFHPKYHKRLEEIAFREVNYHGKTSTGVSYEPECVTITGSPRTALWNTVPNAFISFVALADLYAGDLDMAYNSLGFYGGDDGIVANVTPKSLLSVCDRLGVKIKAELIRPGESVPFLGRILIDPWQTPVNISDVQRQLRKFCFTTAPPEVDDDTALYRKAEAYLITDQNTPVLTPLCKLILKQCKPNKKYLDPKDLPWFAQFGTLFPCSKDDSLLNDVVARNLESDPGIVKHVSESILSNQNIDSLNTLFKNFPSLFDFKIDTNASCNGELYSTKRAADGPIRPPRACDGRQIQSVKPPVAPRNHQGLPRVRPSIPRDVQPQVPHRQHRETESWDLHPRPLRSKPPLSSDRGVTFDRRRGPQDLFVPSRPPQIRRFVKGVVAGDQQKDHVVRGKTDGNHNARRRALYKAKGDKTPNPVNVASRTLNDGLFNKPTQQGPGGGRNISRGPRPPSGRTQ